MKKKDGFDGQRAIIVPAPIIASLCENHPILQQLHVTDIGYYPNAQDHHRHRPEGTPQHIFIYCISGQGWVQVNQQSTTVSAGDFVLLPANVPHEYKADEKNPWTIYWIHFKGDNAPHLANLLMQKKESHVAPISFQQSRLDLFEEIYTSLERGYSTDNICYASMSLHYFLASCCFDGNYNHRLIKEKKDNIDLCINFMQQHIDKSLSLNDIANAVNLSPAHITTLFKKKTGFSIIEYFNQLKIQKACQYLLFTDLRINEIGNKLGIEDQYYFSRLFTKVIGMSPAKYRSSRAVGKTN
jgi:AraC-like DNA-binding protein